MSVRPVHAPAVWSVLVEATKHRPCDRRSALIALLLPLLAALLAFGAFPVAAQDQDIGYFGKNRLEFAAVDPGAFPDATGTGIVDYKGGQEPESQWRASFRFSGLEAGANYAVAIKGRSGEAGSPDADLFTPLCSFRANKEGKGSCFWYFRGLARLDLVQLRTGDENGSLVLEAGRGGEYGSITTAPNRFSPGGEIPDRKRSRNGSSSR